MKRLFPLVLVLFVVGCPPVPAPTPVPEAGDAGHDSPVVMPEAGSQCGTPVRCACWNLCDLQCAGECDVGCEDAFNKVISDRLMVVDLDCAINARSKEEARKCPGVECK